MSRSSRPAMCCVRRSWRRARWGARQKLSLRGEVSRVGSNALIGLTSGLVSDELMLEIVKAELDRLRGKVRDVERRRGIGHC